MIDLRAHIISGLGCGPAKFSESLEMCRAAVTDGVRKVVATPLWKAGQAHPPLPFTELDGRVARLTESLGGNLEIKTGFVFEFSADLPSLVDVYGERLALGGKDHMLVSMPKTSLPAEADRVWEALTQLGFSVVITSLECNLALRRNLEVLDKWSSSGVKLQIDAAGVAGGYGREVQKFAIKCLRRFEGSTVVASNSRGVGGAHVLSCARAELVSRFGERRTLEFVRSTPSTILGDVDVLTPMVAKPTGRPLGRFFRSFQSTRTMFG